MKTKALLKGIRKIADKYPELKISVYEAITTDSVYVTVLNSGETREEKFRFTDHCRQSANHNPAHHTYVLWPSVTGHTLAEILEAFWTDLDNFYIANP